MSATHVLVHNLMNNRKQAFALCSQQTWTVEELPEHTGVVVALGKFDAMHLGHQALAIKVSEHSYSKWTQIWLCRTTYSAHTLFAKKSPPVYGYAQRVLWLWSKFYLSSLNKFVVCLLHKQYVYVVWVVYYDNIWYVCRLQEQHSSLTATKMSGSLVHLCCLWRCDWLKGESRSAPNWTNGCTAKKKIKKD